MRSVSGCCLSGPWCLEAAWSSLHLLVATVARRGSFSGFARRRLPVEPSLSSASHAARSAKRSALLARPRTWPWHAINMKHPRAACRLCGISRFIQVNLSRCIGTSGFKSTASHDHDPTGKPRHATDRHFSQIVVQRVGAIRLAMLLLRTVCHVFFPYGLARHN